MKIINETYMHCEECGTEAFGLYNIDTVFGYKIVNEDITPFSKCKKCRGEDIELEEKRREARIKKWATSAGWGREFNVSRTIFDSYLIELGYLEYGGNNHGRRRKLVVTEQGREHSATSNSMFGSSILWDYDTYLEVIKLRLKGMIVHDICPKCKAYLDTMPGYNHLDYSHTCKRCGRECEYWHVKTVFDR